MTFLKFLCFKLAAVTVLILTLGLSYESLSAPIVSIGKTPTPPAIDGVLDDNCWKSSVKIGNFTTLADSKIAREPTEVYACYDETNIYFGVRCFCSDMGRFPACAFARDSEIWGEDHVEIFLEADAGGYYYQIVVNANGAVWDSQDKMVEANGLKSLKTDTAWNGVCRVASVKDKTCWSAELAVPFVSLGVKCPDLGKEWKVNFTRDEKTVPEMSTWSPSPELSFHDRLNWGKMIFRTATPGFEISALPKVQIGDNECRAKVFNSMPEKKQFKLECKIMPFTKKEAVVDLNPGETREISVVLALSSVLAQGKVRGTLELELEDAGTKEKYYQYSYAPQNKFAEMFILDERNILSNTIHVAMDYPVFKTFWIRHNFDSAKRQMTSENLPGLEVADQPNAMVFELPEGITIRSFDFEKNAEKGELFEKNGVKYTKYRIKSGKITNLQRTWVIFNKSERKENEEVTAFYYLETGESAQTPQPVKIKTIKIGAVTPPTRIYTGIYNMILSLVSNWLPEWETDFKKLGFNTLTVDTGVKPTPVDLVERARHSGFNLRRDYFFIDPADLKKPNVWMEWTEKDENARAVGIDGKFIRASAHSGNPYLLCPSYRGALFQETLDAFVKSGFIEKNGARWFAFDMELWGRNEDNICFCKRCTDLFKDYLAEKRPDLAFIDPAVFEKNPAQYPELHKLWREHFEFQYSGLFKAMKDKFRPVMKSAGLGEPLFSDFDHYVAANDLTERALYDKPQNKVDYIDSCKESFFSSGHGNVYNPTFGQMSPGYEDMGNTPEDLKYLTLESAAAGAKGIYYYTFTTIGDAIHLKNIADAIRMIVKVEDVIVSGRPIDDKIRSSNNAVRARGLELEKDGQAIVLVAEYKTNVPVETEITYCPQKPARVVDLADGAELGRISPGRPVFKVKIEKERARLLHIIPLSSSSFLSRFMKWFIK